MALFLVGLVSILSATNALFHTDVTPSNIDKLLDPAKASVMMEFYAPWCGHCKQLAPEYERLGATFEFNREVIIAQVDADKHKKLAKRFGITGFPTLKWIQKGSSFDNVVDVDVDRTADALLEFINSKTGMSKKLKDKTESSVTDLTPDNFEKLVLNKNTKAFVGFFAPWCGHCKALKPTWEKLAALFADDKEVVIGSIDCDAHKSLAERYNIQGFPTLKYFGSEDPEDYKKGRDLKDFVSFVNSKANLDISPHGGVTEAAGIVAEISEQVKSYMKADTDEERQKLVDICQTSVESLDEKAHNNFKYYAKVFAKIAEKGIEYVKAEKARLSELLESSDNLKSTQKKSFMRRVNVLKTFDEL